MAEPLNAPEPGTEIDEAASEFDTTSDLVLITDPYGLFLRVSPSVKNLLGYEPSEVEGRLATDFIHPLDLTQTRDEMRVSRKTGQARHFYCRYIDKEALPVELIWSGLWLADKEEYVFVGRTPQKHDRLPFSHRMDVLDGFQIAKGLFALALILAWTLDLGNDSTFEIRRLVEFLDGNAVNWIIFMGCYVVACLVCVMWKHRLFQFIVSFTSVFIWIWMGFVTVAAQNYVAAAGIYEIILGLGSICVLYFRGRQL